MLQQIDYQPLAKMEEINLDGKSVNIASIVSRVLKLNMVILIIAVLALFIILVGAGSLFGPAGFFAILLIGVGAGLLINNRIANQESKIWAEFGLANSWKVLPSALGALEIPPGLTSDAVEPKSSSVLSGQMAGQDFNCYRYDCSKPSANKTNNFIFTVLSFKTSSAAPHMVLLSKKGWGAGIGTKGLEKLNLEGDFNQYFYVYGEAGQGTDDLQVLAPDVMQLLIDDETQYNLEIYNGWLHLIAAEDQRLPDRLPKMFQAGLALDARVLRNSPLAPPVSTPPAAPPTIDSVASYGN